ncbi:hypothetical protein MMT22_29320, partial [Escherichia coli]|nr:hypothetical protein [Escherichia coli]
RQSDTKEIAAGKMIHLKFTRRLHQTRGSSMLSGVLMRISALKVKLYVPLARPALALWHRLRGLFFINSYVKGRYLTHDRQRVA